MYSTNLIGLSYLALCQTVLALPTKRQVAVAVLATNFPDPAFIQSDDGFYAFATSGNGKNVQVAHTASFDSPSWQLMDTDALPDPGPWTDGTANIWAPFFVRADDGQFIMYYSARPISDPSKHCIGTASSLSVAGPYSPSASPWACPLEQGGAIDPAVFRDPQSGSLYVTYKIDGNSISDSLPTPLILQRVDSANGITPIGEPITILNKDADDGALIEAPTIMFLGGIYYLIFSTHLFNTDAYDLRYATSNAVTGPYTQSNTPLLKTGDFGLTAPGSGSVDPAGGNFLFHATIGWFSEGQPVRHMFAAQVNPTNGGLGAGVLG